MDDHEALLLSNDGDPQQCACIQYLPTLRNVIFMVPFTNLRHGFFFSSSRSIGKDP